jgi:hypothetical protein
VYCCSVKRHSSSGYHHTSTFELATSKLAQLAESSAQVYAVFLARFWADTYSET